MGPGDESQAHQPDEHMEVEELNRGALAYALTAVAACGLAS
jgi:acetylornithine deacetylase/succinyl-diaminopimelate desuccinylase-like protein